MYAAFTYKQHKTGHKTPKWLKVSDPWEEISVMLYSEKMCPLTKHRSDIKTTKGTQTCICWKQRYSLYLNGTFACLSLLINGKMQAHSFELPSINASFTSEISQFSWKWKWRCSWHLLGIIQLTKLIGIYKKKQTILILEILVLFWLKRQSGLRQGFSTAGEGNSKTSHTHVWKTRILQSGHQKKMERKNRGHTGANYSHKRDMSRFLVFVNNFNFYPWHIHSHERITLCFSKSRIKKKENGYHRDKTFSFCAQEEKMQLPGTILWLNWTGMVSFVTISKNNYTKMECEQNEMWNAKRRSHFLENSNAQAGFLICGTKTMAWN